jgi:hypothetical protein
MIESLEDNNFNRKPTSDFSGLELEKQWLNGEIERNTTEFKELFKKYDVQYVKRQKAEYEAEINRKIKEAIS